MSNMDSKIDAWKNKLLDLGKRNRLINYHDTRRSSLKIKYPEILELWNSFVIDEKPLDFPFCDDLDEDISEITFEGFLGNRNVVTNQAPKEQQKTLHNLRDKAKTVIEEQGVNSLYLSFGFLRWNESEYSDQYFLSPLILVPVTLTWESITSPYILGLHEDEIVLNPTLAYKLESDFGIKLPEFDSDDNISDYFKKISDLISNNKWDVVTDVALCLLSFLKINMYKDLERRKEAICNNAIIRAIGGDASALNNYLEDINDFDFDNKTLPTETFQIVDADSSQQDAILCAKKGISFILQGPPGTGKSQTITNIIAESLADGKKVLFVSEKMAALEVVYNRLSKAGLGDFCLTLHSHKANKKDILEQLGNVLNLSKQKANLSDEAFQKLELLKEDREKLNEYATEIFTIVTPLNKTIYEVNGQLANLNNYEDIIFSLENVINTTPQIYSRYIMLINRFAETIGKMSDDYKSNPWNGANVSSVSNELRHDVSAYLSRLIPKSKQVAQMVESVLSSLQLQYGSSFNDILNLLNIFNSIVQSPKVPFTWVVGDDISPLFHEMEECSKSKIEYKHSINALDERYIYINSINENSNLKATEAILNPESANMHISYINKLICETNHYSLWEKINNTKMILEMFEEAKNKISEYNNKISEINILYESEIFDIDYKQMFLRFKIEYTSFTKIFKKQYKLDKKIMKGLRKDVVKEISDEEIINILSMLKLINELEQWLNENASSLEYTFVDLFKKEETNFDILLKEISTYMKLQECLQILNKTNDILKNLEKQETALKSHYEFLYDGINTDWEIVFNSLNWAKVFRDIVEKHNLNKEFVEIVCIKDGIISELKSYIDSFQFSIQNFNQEFTWYLNLFDNEDLIKSINMPALTDRLERCLNGLASLEEWIDFRTARTNCINYGLLDFIDKVEITQIKVASLIPIFKKRFFRLWLDAIMPSFPAVLNFRRKVHESTIDEFASLDKLQFEIAKARIRSKLINDLPSLNHFTSGVDEISILKRELGKQRRIMPIRKLFKEIPNLLLTLKPCLMMSPLSVSLFLEAESYMFDTIIFDEASQVCTENAIGAISRGKQVIIAGDSKQLPPTNFFNATTSDSDFDLDIDDELYDDVSAYESILDESGLLPERTLIWHYRSRHEHLIAFSNSKIYKNSLITFPSNIEKMANNGVEYVHVKDGFYDRGGKNGNVNEANKIAELVFDHFKTHPERSLGVVAFGEVQQQAINCVIRQMRMQNQQFEPFFSDNLAEPFFIKNLENVQGDERDTIIFSIGYAKDSSGKMHMFFGPLSSPGGERRLNVAITRAKYNVKLVGSIVPTDIEIEKISSEGPKLLRSYIDYAINGIDVLKSDITESDIIEHDSPFEEAVFNYLDRKGYKVCTQVGCSGYRIDMAVKHPKISGKYVIGIECDGAAYHSARTARERDRLRQSLLESMGWKIYRIWSTDWIKDPITEGQKLIEAIENAISEDSDESTENICTIENHQVEDFLKLDTKEVSLEMSSNPYGFLAYNETDLSSVFRDRDDVTYVINCIYAIVINEYPVHYELLCQKLAGIFGNEKATVKVRNYINFVLPKMNAKVTRKGDFLYPKDFTSVPVRTPNTRKINHIDTEELAEAMLIISGNCYGTTREALCAETCRAYGFNRSGQNITTALNKAYEMLIKSGKAKEVDGKVVASQF